MDSIQKIDIELESVAVDSERSQNISAGQEVVLRDAKDGTIHVFSSNELMLGSFSRAGELQTLDPAKCTARVQTVKRGVGNGQLSVVIRVRHPIDVIKSQEYVDPAAKQAGIAAVSGVGGGITAAAAAAAAEEIDLFNKEQLVSFAFNKEILDMLRDPELRWQVTKVAQAGACVVEDTSRDAIPDRDSCVKEHGTTPGRDHDDLHTVASQALHDPKMSALVEMAMGTIPSHQSA